MERIQQLTIFLQEQGYFLPNAQNRPGFHMYHSLGGERFPRFHFQVPLDGKSGLLLSQAGLHYDRREHRTPFIIGSFQDIQAQERLRFKQALIDADVLALDSSIREVLLDRISYLLLFENAEHFHQVATRGTRTRQEYFFDAMKQRRRKDHRKYVRDHSWRQEILDEVNFTNSAP